MKVCRVCQQSKPSEEYNRNSESKDGLHLYCRACLRIKRNEWYRNSASQREAAKLRNKKYQIELREWIASEVKKGGCCICGEPDPACLDFHHVVQEEKTDWVYRLISLNSRRKLEVELQKCAVVCSNCHRKIHAGIVKNPVDKRLKDIKVPMSKTNT